MVEGLIGLRVQGFRVQGLGFRVLLEIPGFMWKLQA